VALNAQPCVPAGDAEEVLRSGLHIGTRLPNGTVVTLVVGLTPRLGELFVANLKAALARGEVCAHVLSLDVWCFPVVSARVLCVQCALSEDASWQRGAACALCGEPAASLAILEVVGRVPSWPGHWTTRQMTNLCPCCVLAETGLTVVL